MGRGCSSAGRAPALQAGGRRFEPDHLHYRGPRFCADALAKASASENPPEGRFRVTAALLWRRVWNLVVRPRSSQWKSEFRRSDCCTLDRRRRFLRRCRVLSRFSIGSRFGARWFGCCLFFVRVNQVLVRLWARCQGKGGSIAIFSPKSQSLTGTCVSWRRGMWRPATAANAFKDVGICVCLDRGLP